MSYEYEVMWRLEQEKKEKLRKQRAGEYVEKALKAISEQYKKFLDSEYDSYVPSEMQQIKKAIDEISSLKNTDPIQAQNLCYEINSTINQMNYLVQSTKLECEKKERLRYEEILRKKEAKSTLLSFYYGKLAEIKNPQVVNFCMTEIKQLKEKIEKEEISREDAITKSFAEIENVAETKYSEWKTNKIQTEKTNILKENIKSFKDEIEKQKFENENKKNEILKELSELENSLAINISESDFFEKLNGIREKSEETLVTEAARKEVVISIIKELKDMEFAVEKPKILGEGKDSCVIINAKKPSGKHAVCKINLEGKLNYRFDNYEGMTCIKDTDKFNEDLKKIYSIDFSDDRVIWENPDRLSRTQNMSSSENRRNM